MRFLLDEMFPARTCIELDHRGHDAINVRQRGIDARPDVEVAAVARAEERVLVTENVKDFAGESGLVVLVVLTQRLPPGGLSVHLANLIDAWAAREATPYVGLHWP